MSHLPQVGDAMRRVTTPFLDGPTELAHRDGRAVGRPATLTPAEGE